MLKRNRRVKKDFKSEKIQIIIHKPYNKTKVFGIIPIKNIRTISKIIINL